MSQIDVSDLRSTIVPKSDQLNAEQLLGGPITVTITDVRIGSTADQPISVHYEGENGRPYKPCKTMRKVLIFAWGPDGHEWVGRSLRLYNDPQVKFGGDEVGGVRISHMSDIDRDVQVSLTATRGKKALHTIRVMPKVVSPPANLADAQTVEALRDAFRVQYRAARGDQAKARLKTAYDARLAELIRVDADPETGEISAPAETYAVHADRIVKATSAETGLLALESATDLPEDQYNDLVALYKRTWERTE